jgi:Carboxypeptidase regulatory-like domain
VRCETKVRSATSNTLEHSMTTITKALAVILLALAVSISFAQKKGSDTGTRSVEGVVSNSDESPAAGAVVQLENTKTQQIRSYITKEDGKYRFYELSTEVDYKLKAEHNGVSSGSKLLSSFDGRKQAIVNLKLNAK